jgi:hypothetical protein
MNLETGYFSLLVDETMSLYGYSKCVPIEESLYHEVKENFIDESCDDLDKFLFDDLNGMIKFVDAERRGDNFLNIGLVAIDPERGVECYDYVAYLFADLQAKLMRLKFRGLLCQSYTLLHEKLIEDAGCARLFDIHLCDMERKRVWYFDKDMIHARRTSGLGAIYTTLWGVCPCGMETGLRLSEREKEIIFLRYRKMMTREQIAQAMFISRRTVERHFERIFDKGELIGLERSEVALQSYVFMHPEELWETDIRSRPAYPD